MGKPRLLMEGCFERWRKVDFSGNRWLSLLGQVHKKDVQMQVCCPVPVVFVSALTFHSQRLTFITRMFFFRGPVVDGELTFIAVCFFWVLSPHRSDLHACSTAPPSHPILAISAAMDLLPAVPLQTCLIPRLLSSNVIWTHHAFEEEENQRVDPTCGFHRIEHA